MDMPVLPIVRRKCLRSARRLGPGGALLTRAFATVLAAALPVGTLHAAEAAAGPTAGTRIEISTGEPAGGPLHVIGTEGRRQLVVSAVPAGADADHERDVTRQASYRVEPETLATVTPEGVVIPSADGQGEIVIKVSAVPGLTDLPETRVPLVVERRSE